jgi:type I restriction enzyme, S subunit
LRQAMGPYDPKLMRSIDKQLKENKWFEYQQSESLKYKPLEKAGQHKADFEKYFSTEKKDIQYLIDKFIKAKSETIEIVATLYACLDHILNNKEIYSEALLMKRFYEWSDQKAKFDAEEVKKLFAKMVDLGVVPAKFKALA